MHLHAIPPYRESLGKPVPGASAAGPDAMMRWALAQLGPNNRFAWPRPMCLRFVRETLSAHGHDFPMLHAGSAAHALSIARRQGQLRRYSPDQPPPKGALIFWPPTRDNGGYGHVAISAGDGQVVTSGWPNRNGSVFPGGLVSLDWMTRMESHASPAGWVAVENPAAAPVDRSFGRDCWAGVVAHTLGSAGTRAATTT